MKPTMLSRSGGSPGTARNMPTKAVNTISATTRGLVSVQYSRQRAMPGRLEGITLVRLMKKGPLAGSIGVGASR